MSPEAWTFAGTSVAALAGLAAERYRTRQQMLAKVEAVRKLAEPLGNGFAQVVLDALHRIEDKVDRQAASLRRHKRRDHRPVD